MTTQFIQRDRHAKSIKTCAMLCANAETRHLKGKGSADSHVIYSAWGAISNATSSRAVLQLGLKERWEFINCRKKN